MNEDDTGEDQENWGRDMVIDDRHGDEWPTNFDGSDSEAPWQIKKLKF